MFVDNPSDFFVDIDQGAPGLDNGDSVTWNPGAGSQHGGSESGLIFGTDAFSTIQGAVNQANAVGGDVIRVGPGTFSELVTVNKQVSLLGNQVDADAQSGRVGAAETIVNGNAGSTSFYVTANGVELNGFTIKGTTNGNQFGSGILLGAGTSGSMVLNNIIEENIIGISLANNSAIAQTVISGNLIRNNNQAGPASGTGIYTDQFNAGGTLTNVLIDNNTFAGNGNSTNGGAALGFSSTSAAQPATNVVISNNRFDGNARAMYAFSLTNSSFKGNELKNANWSGTGDLRLFEGVNNLAISNNLMQNGAGDAVRISNAGTGLPNATGVTLTENSISGYAGDGVELVAGQYTGPLNAQLNWWGSPTGPTNPGNPAGSGETIVDPDGLVSFSPFLASGVDAQPAVRGFQPVSPPPIGIAIVGSGFDDQLIITATSADDGSYQLITDGVPGPVVPFTDIAFLSFAGGDGNDTLRVNNPAGGLFAPSSGVFYVGGGQSGTPGDRLEILGGAHTGETHTFLPAAGGNRGTIALVNGGTTATYSYSGLEPVLVNAGTPSDVVFNLPTGDGNNNATLGDDGLANGLSQIAGTGFETTTFANPSGSLTVNVGSDGETFTLATLDAAFAATTLSLNGSASAEIFNVLATPASTTTTVSAGNGQDVVNVSSNGAALSGNLNGLNGLLRLDAGANSGDVLNISESGLAIADDVTITGMSYTGTAGGGWQIQQINFGFSGGVNVSLGSAGDTVEVVSTTAGQALSVNTNGGADTIDVGDASNSLDSLAANVTVNAGGQAGDTLNINDQGDATNNTYSVSATQVVRSGGPTITYSGLTALVLNAGTGNDTINLNSIAAGTATSISAGDGNDNVVFANGVSLNGGKVDGGAGTNSLNYSAYTTPVVTNLGLGTTGLGATLQGDQEVPAKTTAASGKATVSNYDPATKTFDITVTVDGLAPADVTGFHIHSAPFNVNGPIFINFMPGGVPIAPLVPTGTGFTFTATGLTLPAGQEAAFLGGLTYVNVHTAANPGGEIRGQLFSNANVNLPTGTSTGTGGISNIQNVTGGSSGDSLVGSFGANVLTGNAGNDTILGAPGNDTMAGGDNDDVLIWSNGDNNDVMDGGSGNDRVQVNGSVAGDDVIAIGAGAGGRVAVNRSNLAPFALDIGTTETLSVVGVGGADTMTVNSLAGVTSLNAINLAGLDGNDRFNVNPTASAIAINVQGHQPVFHTLPGDTLNYIGPGTVAPSGIGGGTISQPGFQDVTFSSIERLTGGPFDVVTPGAIDVFNNKIDASIVTIKTAEGQVSIDADAINTLTPGSGVVNMIGDNDDTIDQTDNFVVVGTGPNAFTLSINGSPVVRFRGVTHLNVIGHELVDTLELTAFADNSGGPGGNQPRGWGIDVFYDEGLPNQTDGAQQDLLIYHTSQGLGGGGSVSENIVVQPSGPDSGEVRGTNAVDGSMIVVVQYVANTDIVIDDDDGSPSDTDTVALRGTNPDGTLTSGNDRFTADFTNAGTPAEPQVIVQDDDNNNILYRLRDLIGFDTITLQALAGNDSFDLVGRADGSLTLNVDGGEGFNLINLDATTNDDFYSVSSLATTNDAGLLVVSNAAAFTDVNFNHIAGMSSRPLGLHPNSGIGGAFDDLELFGNSSQDVFRLFCFSDSNSGIVELNGFNFTFEGLGTTGNGIVGLFGGTGSDQFVIHQPTSWGVGNARLIGTGSSTTTLFGSGLIDYTPAGAEFGLIDLTSPMPGGLTTTYQIVSGALNVSGGETASGALRVAAAHATITPGATPGSGLVEPVDASGNPLLPLSYSKIPNVTLTGGTAVVQGTAANDTITLSAAGEIVVTNNLGFTNVVNVAGYNRVVINALGGDDDITIAPSGLFAGGVTVLGGEPGGGSDSLSITDNNPNLNFAANQITNVVGGPISIDGIETVNLTGASAGDFTVTGYGFATDVRTLNLIANGTDDVDISATDLPDTIRFQPLSASAAKVTRGEGGPTINVSGFNNATGNFSVDTLGNLDTVEVIASAGNDLIRALQAGSGIAVEVIANGNPSGGVKWVPIDFRNGESLVIDGGLSNDLLELDNTNGPVILTQGTTFHGGAGDDTIRLSGTTPVASVVYSVGPNVDEGTILHNFGGQTQRVFFTGVEPIVDTTLSPTLTINATSADNAINYTQGAAAANGLVSIDGFESYEFSNKTTLILNGQAGSDTINLNNSSTPTGLTGITVNAGDPTGSDRLIVNGQAGVFDPMVVEPTAQGAGTVVYFNGNLPNVDFTGTEDLSLVGQLADGDSFGVDGTLGDDVLEYVPGATPSSGKIIGTLNQNSAAPAGPFSLVPVNFSGMAQASLLQFNVTGQIGGQDAFIYNGTTANDDVRLAFFAPNQVEITNTALGQLFTNLVADNIVTATVRTGAGDDAISVLGAPTVALVIDGGDPAANDVVNVLDSGNGALTVDWEANVVQEAGASPVTLSGIETLNVNAAGQSLTIAASSSNDVVSVTPTGAASATATLVSTSPAIGARPVVNGTNIGTLLVDLLGGSDQLLVSGTGSDDAIAIDGDSVDITGLESVGYAGAEDLTVQGLGGDDAFAVTASAVRTFVDGGNPVGTVGDTLQMIVPAGALAVTFRAGPESDEGGYSFAGGGIQSVSYDHIEAVGPIDVGPAGGVVNIVATNADNDITILGIDADSLTVSIDGGPAIQYDGVTTLNVDALAGDDDIAVTVGPLSIDAINITGNDPTASDELLVNGTENFDSVVFSPTSAGSGALTGLNTPVNFNTTEHVTYNGLDGDDRLFYATPAGSDHVIFEPGLSPDAASISARRFNGTALAPLNYLGLGAGGQLSIGGGSGPDSLELRGTALDDLFTVTPAGQLRILKAEAGGQPARTVPINTIGVSEVTLQGLAGDDTFNVPGDHRFAVLTIEGGDPSASDVLNFAASGNGANLVSVNAGLATVQETGSAPVHYTGIEVLNVDANSNAPHDALYMGTPGDDRISATPTDSEAVTIRLATSAPGIGAAPAANFANVGTTMTLDGGGGTDELALNGTAGGDTINVTRTTGSLALEVLGRQALTPTNSFAAWTVNGLEGSDTINVTDGSPATAINLLINGGSGAADVLNYLTTVSTVYRPGDASDAGFLTRNALETQFTGIDAVNVVFSSATGTTGTIDAGGGANQITVVGVAETTVNATVDGHSPVTFTGDTLTTINVLAGDGSDTISVTPRAFTGSGGINIAGGDPPDQDLLIVGGSGGADTVTVAPTSFDTATVMGLAATIRATGVERLRYEGQGGGDLLTFATPTDSDHSIFEPGLAPDAAAITSRRFGTGASLVPFEYADLGVAGQLTIAGGGGSPDSLELRGTNLDDEFTVSAAGQVRIFKSEPGGQPARTVPINTSGVVEVTLQGLAGDDNFNIPGNQPYAQLVVEGGDPSASDVLNFTASATVGNAVTANLGAATVQEATFNAVTYTGIELLNVNASGHTSTSVLGTAGNDQLSVTPTGAAAATTRLVSSSPGVGATPVVNASNLGATFTVDAAGGTDSVTVNGTSVADTINVVKGATTTVQVNALQTISLPAAGNENVSVEAGDGGDTINVSGTASSGQLLAINGGSPTSNSLTAADTLNVTLATAGTTTVSPGATPDAGTLLNPDGAINFAGLEFVTLAAAAAGANTVTFSGTHDNDTLALQFLNGANRVWINDRAVVSFSNYQTVNLNGLFGDDSISVVPTGLVGVTAINVAGGDPTASDKLIVTATAGDDTLGYNPSDTIGSGNVTVNAAPPIAFTTTEAVVLDGQGGTDALTVTTAAGTHQLTYTPGAAPDAGQLDIRREGVGTGLVPLTFAHLGASGSVSFASAGGREDVLELNGTGNSDVFNVNSPADAVQIANPAGGLVTDRLNTGGINVLELRGKEGDDVFNLTGTLPYTTTLVGGGDPSASDVVNLTAAAGPVTVNYQTSTVTGYGGTVALLGVEVLNADASTQSLTVNATAGDDVLEVTPTGANAATVRLNSSQPAIGSTPVLNAANIGTLNVDLLGGSDTLVVNATQGADAIAVTSTAVTINALEVVNFANANAVRVFGQAGDDAFTVTPAAIPVFVDGGDPIGVTPGDSLTVNGAIGFFAGPENDEGGFLTLGGTVSFDHIESLTAGPNGDCAFLIVGTNGDDDITVIARDASYIVPPAVPPAGLDGIQDFTVSVNGGPNILFVDEPDLFIDAGNGDDDIVIRTPAPNGAAWDVNVRVAGGPPSIGEPNEADRLVLETPGQDSVEFRPTGPDTGSLVVNEDGVPDYQPGGADSIITFGSFVFTCDDPAGPPVEFTYNSSPGGVELVEYDGELAAAGISGTDDITIFGTSLDDTTSVSPLGVGPGGTGQGTFSSPGSPLFYFRGFDDSTVTGGSGGFDQISLFGTEGPDVITSTATVIDFGGGVTVTLGSGLDSFKLTTLGGSDNVNLDLNTGDNLQSVIDLGDGNDVLDLRDGVFSVSSTIYGGPGDDIIDGTDNADTIYGGSGNDIIISQGGDDTIYGEEGNDSAQGGVGIDRFFGGDGSDVFTCIRCDGRDIIEGGADESDAVVYVGNDLAETFTLTAAGTRVDLARDVDNIHMDIAGVEQIILQLAGGDDNAVVNDLYDTDVRLVNVRLGTAGTDAVTVQGRNIPDTITAAASGTSVQVQGLRYDIQIEDATSAADTLTINGNDGDDTIKAIPGVESQIAIVLNGNQGNDYLSADATLNGGDGNDTLIGGVGADTYNGGAGDDTLVVSDGADTMSGGTGFDIVLYQGTEAGETLDLDQTGNSIAVAGVHTGTIDVSAADLERIDINGEGGDDTIGTLSGLALPIIADGGAGNDTISGSPTVTSPMTIFGRDGNDTLTGGNVADLIYGGFGNDILIGAGAGDTLYGEEGDDRFGEPAARDTAANDPGDDRFFGGAGSDTFFWDPGDNNDTIEGGADESDILIFSGAAAAENLTLNAVGTRLEVLRNLGNVDLDVAGVEQVSLLLGDGDDTAVVNDLYTTDVKLVSIGVGATGSDAVTVQGRNANDKLLASAVGTSVQIAGLRYDVRIDDATAATDTLTINGNDGDDSLTATTAAGALIGITLSGNDGNDTLAGGSTENGGNGDDVLYGSPGNDALNGGAGNDTYIPQGGIDTVTDTSGNDVILMPGSAGSDGFLVALAAGGADLQVTTNGLLTTYPGITGTGLDRILVKGQEGNDALTVNSTNGAIPLPIEYDGDGGNDFLTLTGGTATSDIYSVGPNPGQGVSQITIGAVTQIVTFSNIEPVNDVVAGPLVINATPADNSINYSQGSSATTGLVTVDNFESIEFTNKTLLTLNAQAGSDTINLNNPSTPTSLTRIIVNGGDPTGREPNGGDSLASDRLVVNGTTLKDNINYHPTGPDTGSVTGAGPIPIDFNTTEGVTINGQGGADSLTHTSSGTGNHLSFYPGSAPDTATILADTVAGTLLAPLYYTGLGGTGEVTLATDGNEHLLDFYGTNDSELFSLDGSGGGRLQLVRAGSLPITVPVNTPGIRALVAHGLAGNDTFTISTTNAWPDGVTIDGGAPSASDVANFGGASGPVTVTLADRSVVVIPPKETTVTGYGSTVTLLGTEIANLQLGGNTLRVVGTSQDDTIRYTPSGATAGNFQQTAPNTGGGTLFYFTQAAGTAANAFVIDGGDGVANKVEVQGTNGRDLFGIDEIARTVTVTPVVAAWQPVTLAGNIQRLDALGQGGQDTFLVTPAAGMQYTANPPLFPIGNIDNLVVNVDGGGSGENNALVIGTPTGGALAANQFVVLNRGADGQSGTARTFTGGVQWPDINYSNVQVVTPKVATTTFNGRTAPNLLIMGPDLNEPNETQFHSAFVGADSTLQVQHASVFPNANEFPFVPADQDFYQVVAQYTGTLDIQVYFDLFDPALLPAGGNLIVQAFDAAGNKIADSAATGALDSAGGAAGPAVFGALGARGNARVRIPAVEGQSYYFRIVGANPGPNASAATAAQVVNGYDVTIINTAPPAPYDIELDDLPVNPLYVCPQVDPNAANSDTGRSHFDNITCDATPTIRFRLDDGIFLHDLPGNGVNDTPPAGVIPIPFQAGAGAAGYRVAVFDEGPPQQGGGVLPQIPLGFATQVAEGVYEFTTPTLTDGSHFLSARVQMVDPATPQQTGFGDRSVSLEVVIDTIAPPAFFGLPNDPDDGLLPDSDTGVNANPETLNDRVTSNTTPGFFGEAEADAVIRLFVDLNADGTVNPDGTGDGIFTPGVDFQVGFDVAEPFDGNNQYPRGYWQVDAINFNLNAAPFPRDGQRTLFLTAEDVAGNINPGQGVIRLDIFLDTQGPQITDVTINSVAQLIGLSANNSLVRFDSNAPNTVIATTPVANLGGNTLVAIDVLPVPRGNVRPGTLVGLGINAAGTSAQVYAIQPDTGFAQAIGSPFNVTSSTGYGLDFNPTSGLLRIVNTSNENFRFDVANGTVTTDTPLTPGAADIAGSAYDRNDSDPSSTTTLFGIDSTADTLVRQGGVNGLPSPNGGVITTIGSLGVNTDANVGFDIARGTNMAYAALHVGATSGLYTLNLATGQADLVGSIGDGATTIVGLTVLPAYDLFDPKPSTDGPTPAVNSLVISFRDLPARTAAFLIEALKLDVADTPGLYRVTGDQNGIIPIVEIIVNNLPPVAGQPALATVELVFRDAGPDGLYNTADDIGAPLPDDRFTLFVDDEIIDLAGNHLDGESNAAEPQEFPSFPTGDGIPGGDFVGRFTVDSRPEIGNYSAGSAFIDINGNMQIDPQGDAHDYTNRDLAFQIGTISDSLFAGKFEPAALSQNDNDGFDKLGAYGYDNFAKEYRFLLDFNHDGVADFRVASAYQVNAIAVAGNFAPNHPGDEIGMFDGSSWYLDTDGDNQLDTVIASNMQGNPIVGDFNGDGADDLATYDAGKNKFSFDLNRDGQTDNVLAIGGPVNGYTELPIAGDFNLDGIDDLGLWGPNRQGSPTRNLSEWYLLLSDHVGPTLPSQIFDPYAPAPLGNDLFAQFGDHFSLPLFGNFDPPVASSAAGGSGLTNARNGLDVNNDGFVAPNDALTVINHINGHIQPEVNALGLTSGPYIDVDGDGVVAPRDVLEVINYLNATPKSVLAAGLSGDDDSAEGESHADAFAADDILEADLLAFLASDVATARQRQGKRA